LDVELLAPPERPRGPAERLRFEARRPLHDHVYRSVARISGAITLAVMGLIFGILVIRSTRAIHLVGFGKFLATQRWVPEGGSFGIGSLLFNTVAIAIVAMAIAVPVAIGTSLFITEYAPRAVRGPLTALVDLLAAVPSVIYGVWGVAYLTPRARLLSQWLAHHLAFIPIFKTSGSSYAGSTFIVGIVLALMVTPITTAVVRQVFAQAPSGQREAALSLGGTRWGMIRSVVLPYGRGGIIGGTMLGFGRALGETVAVALIISHSFVRQVHVLQSGTNSISAMIAERWGEAGPIALSALMAAGLSLFLFTLVVNAVASIVVTRSASGENQEI
jgi:phosphate transport system permease protein